MNSESVSEGGRAAKVFDKIKADSDLQGENPELNDLKREINLLLWCFLPRQTTIGKAEDIACTIFEIIDKEWE